MLAELVDHVIGVDPDPDWITVAALDSRTSGVISSDRFPATRDGYRDAIAWADAHTVESERAWADAHTVESERAWVVEGTASYGRGLTMALQGRDELVIEFDRPVRKAAKDGAKSDALDAIRAAREALGRDKLNQPRAHDGIREAIRVHELLRSGRAPRRSTS
jgi:transposase